MPNELAKGRHRFRENAGSLRQINLLERRLLRLGRRLVHWNIGGAEALRGQ